jgi:hypothetical protein
MIPMAEENTPENWHLRMMKRLWNGCSENIKGGGSMQYRKYGVVFAIFLMFTALFTGCSRNPREEQISSSRAEIVTETVEKAPAPAKDSATEAIADPELSTEAPEPEDYVKTGYKADTKVWDVIDDPAFAGYGRLIFPADRSIEKSMTLSEVGSILPYYTYVNTDRTVEIVNYMKTKAEAGEQIFYDIYTDGLCKGFSVN